MLQVLSKWLGQGVQLLPFRVKPFLSRLSLQKRIILYIAIWLVVVSLVYTSISLQAIEQSRGIILRERLALAQTIAAQLDSLLEHAADELENVGDNIASAIEVGNIEAAGDVLGKLYRHWTDDHHFAGPSVVSLVDPDGQIIWREPAGVSKAEASAIFYPDFQKLVRPEGLNITFTSSKDGLNQPTASIAVPVSSNGSPIAYLISQVDLTHSGYGLASDLNITDTGYTVELVDQSGQVLVSTEAGSQDKPSIHVPLFTDELRTHRADVKIHELPEDENHGSHIVAYAPLEQVPGGIFVEQKENIALQLPRLLRTQLVLFGVFVLTAGLVTAWLATRSAVGPVSQLIAVTRRIASGDLDYPVPVQRQDEIGQLAVAFERMRQDLAAERRRMQDLAILEERDRLAREMHDGFAQALSILNLNAKAVRQAMMTGDEAQAVQTLDALDQIIDQAYADVREAISSLRTTVPYEEGLIAAVSQYLEEFGLQYGLDTKLSVEGAQDICFTTSQEIQLLRIIQEALSNVRKHAEADQVQVQFEQKIDHEVEISIADNGLGFDLAAVERGAKQAFGLVIMRERAESLNGSFHLQTHSGAGTTVVVRIPLEQEGTEHRGTDAHPIGG